MAAENGISLYFAFRESRAKENRIDAAVFLGIEHLIFKDISDIFRSELILSSINRRGTASSSCIKNRSLYGLPGQTRMQMESRNAVKMQ